MYITNTNSLDNIFIEISHGSYISLSSISAIVDDNEVEGEGYTVYLKSGSSFVIYDNNDVQAIRDAIKKHTIVEPYNYVQQKTKLKTINNNSVYEYDVYRPYSDEESEEEE